MCEEHGTTTEAATDEPPATPLPVVPSVGRIVHYWHRGSADGVYPPKCSAAIVSGVTCPEKEIVSLTVFSSDGGMWPHPAVEHDEGDFVARRPGTWHYPEYVPVATDKAPAEAEAPA